MRKTNLFYNAGQDSNFVTFSNYTEALTGNILATNAKLVPSKFICLYVPSLDSDDFQTNKSEFIIRYLSGYYENKLASIRDEFLKSEKSERINIEQSIYPLNYLLDCIYMFDKDTVISFIGDICEQDYNGTFMDNICIIESNTPAMYYKYSSTKNPDKQISVESEISHFFHGWENATKMPSGYDQLDVVPKYDNYKSVGDETDGQYVGIYYPNMSNITLEEVSEYGDKTIKFNVLIPLFSIYTINRIEYYENLGRPEDDETYKTKTINELIFDSGETHNQYDTPLGMWFSDKCIELERTSELASSYRPSWSLCISSQFKPFPFSDKYPNEITDYNNPDKFATFALVLAKQSALLNEISSLKESIAKTKYTTNVVPSGDVPQNYVNSTELEELTNRVESIENQISNIGSNIAMYAELDNSLRLTKDRFNSAYNGFNESYTSFTTIYSDYKEVAERVNDQIQPILLTFDENYHTAEAHFNEIEDKYKQFGYSYATFEEQYGYYVPSYTYFNDSYTYYSPSYTYFNDAYGYFVPSYEYYVPSYEYFVPSYLYFSYIVDHERWSEKAYDYAREAYNSYYVPSYSNFLVDYGQFRNDYDTYYVPSYGYFNNAYGYFYGSYGYFYDSYGYFTNTYNTYLTPAYEFFTYGYEYFVDVMAKEWWAHNAYSYMRLAYSSYMIPSYGYFVPQIGYFRPEMGYFHPKIHYFTNSYSFFVPSYNYFKMSYPYFEQHYPVFEERWNNNIEYWEDFVEKYSYFVPRYGEWDKTWMAYDRFYDTYTYYITTYDTYFVPEMGYFRDKYGSFNRSYDNGIGTFRPSYAYFSTSYNNYLSSYNYFRIAYSDFLYKTNNFNTDYAQFNSDYAKFDNFNDAYNHVYDIYNAIGEQYTNFNNSYDSLRREHANINLSIDWLDGRIKELENKNLDSRISELENTIANLIERISQLEENN